MRSTRRWRSLRRDQLTREDIRDVAQIETLGLLETLSDVLAQRSGQQLIYSNLANAVGIAVDTVRRWIDLLERLHYGFVDFLVVRDRKPWMLVEVKTRDTRVQADCFRQSGPAAVPALTLLSQLLQRLY